jgi:hypothetical protein
MPIFLEVTPTTGQEGHRYAAEQSTARCMKSNVSSALGSSLLRLIKPEPPSLAVIGPGFSNRNNTPAFIPPSRGSNSGVWPHIKSKGRCVVHEHRSPPFSHSCFAHRAGSLVLFHIRSPSYCDVTTPAQKARAKCSLEKYGQCVAAPPTLSFKHRRGVLQAGRERKRTRPAFDLALVGRQCICSWLY